MDLQYIFVCAVVLLITCPEWSKYLLDQEVWDNWLPPSLNLAEYRMNITGPFILSVYS